MERVIVDTNVLLAATDRSRQAHDTAVRFLADDPRELTICPQIIREYLSVSTRPVEANGLGLTPARAVANVGQVQLMLSVVPESELVTTALLDLVSDGLATGKQVHDANIVAVALTHGASAIVTDNTRHFGRFAHLVGVQSL